MPPQTRRTSGPPPRSAARQVTPPVVDIPPATPPVEPVEAEPAQSEPVSVDPPPFNPDDPRPGQSIRAYVPHSGYTAFAYGHRSFAVDPDTDLIVAETT